ncbi:phage tail protein [Serratia sp. root2]|uniref:phage tail protein n=1 Tax=Serratia sp. root2 TaxID=3059676 RepID=UPI00288F14C7|nr:phage tail protein [Serratia sp. root2]MDT3252759.1 phage tail protein [Serratia sp. root2]
MSQLTSLTAFLQENLPVRVRDFDSYMDDQKIVSSNKDMGMGQRRIGYTTYTGELRWDDWPYRLCDPQLLYTLVLVWLGDHANDLREELGLEDPDIDPQPIDEQTAIVSVSVPLVDELGIIEDEDGPVPHDNKRWRLGDPVVLIAETATVYGADNVGANVDGNSE